MNISFKNAFLRGTVIFPGNINKVERYRQANDCVYKLYEAANIEGDELVAAGKAKDYIVCSCCHEKEGLPTTTIVLLTDKDADNLLKLKKESYGDENFEEISKVRGTLEKSGLVKATLNSKKWT